MSMTRPECSQNRNESPRSYPVLEWVMCHPGVLMFSSLAVGTMLAARREVKREKVAERRVETEADIVEGDVPLFI